MTQTVRIPSEADLALIQEMLDAHRRLPSNGGKSPQDGSLSEHSDHQANDIYIAIPRTEDGIPPLIHLGTGTGTDAFNDGDTPGSAECDIYQIIDVDGTDTLVQASGELGDIVYNLSEEQIEQGWILIYRDKFGRWIASVIHPKVRMIITEMSAPSPSGTGTGTGSGSGNSLGPVVYRTSHPNGLTAKRLNSSESPFGIDITIYADFVRGVYANGDKVWVSRKNGKWQINDDATLMWTALTEASLVNGGPGKVTIFHATGNFTVMASIYDPQDSISSGSTCLVLWIDQAQQFRAIPVICPNPIVQVGGNIGGTG